MNRLGRLALLPLLIVVAGLVAVEAADRTVGVQMNQRFVVDNNPRLRTGGGDIDFGSVTSVSGNFSWATGRTQTLVNGAVSIGRYVSDSRNNTEDLSLSFSHGRKYLRSDLSFGGAVRRATTLLTEVEDAGEFDNVSDQTQFNLNIGWTYRLTPLNSIAVNGAWTGRYFDSSGFSGSNTLTSGLTWSRRYSPRSTISVGGQVTYITSEDVGRGGSGADVVSFGVNGGWQHRLSQRANLSFSAGPRVSQVVAGRRTGGNDTDVGVNLSLALSYQWREVTSLTLAASQSLEPTSRGGVEQRQRISFGLTHRLSHRGSISTSLSYQRNGDSLTGFSDDTRNFGSVSVSYSYRISRYVSMSLQYSFRAQTFSSVSDVAVSNGVAVFLTYSPRKWRLGD